MRSTTSTSVLASTVLPESVARREDLLALFNRSRNTAAWAGRHAAFGDVLREGMMRLNGRRITKAGADTGRTNALKPTAIERQFGLDKGCVALTTSP